MEVYIVRHGQTIWNASGKMQGSTDIELNENGKAMAVKLGEQLKDVSFDCIFSSPLIRAYETACLIRGDREIPIIRDPRLKEICFGDMEGCTLDEWYRGPGDAFFRHPEDYIAPANGESLAELCERAGGFVRELEADPKYERIMIVAHGALNKGLMYRIEKQTPATFWGKGLQKNCEATIFAYRDNAWIKLKD